MTNVKGILSFFRYPFVRVTLFTFAFLFQYKEISEKSHITNMITNSESCSQPSQELLIFQTFRLAPTAMDLLHRHKRGRLVQNILPASWYSSQQTFSKSYLGFSTHGHGHGHGIFIQTPSWNHWRLCHDNALETCHLLVRSMTDPWAVLRPDPYGRDLVLQLMRHKKNCEQRISCSREEASMVLGLKSKFLFKYKNFQQQIWANNCREIASQ